MNRFELTIMRLAKSVQALNCTVEEFNDLAHGAASSPRNDLPDPTQAQIEAGTYKKGHVRVHGLEIAIENPEGSTRSGIDNDGNPWSVEMKHHYGYIKGTIGKDKDHIDVFINPENPESDSVYVVNQYNPEENEFDEHKCMIGFASAEEALDAYQSNYSEGWEGARSITPMAIRNFKLWCRRGDARKGELVTEDTIELDQDAKIARIASVIAMDFTAGMFDDFSGQLRKLGLQLQAVRSSAQELQARAKKSKDDHTAQALAELQAALGQFKMQLR